MVGRRIGRNNKGRDWIMGMVHQADIVGVDGWIIAGVRVGRVNG
jgi:hypothetical protein